MLLEGKRARGVALFSNGTEQEALASQVIVSAGGIGSPQLLQASGIGSIGEGFFCDPLIAVFGTAEGVQDVGEFPMAAGVQLRDEGYMLTDLPLPKATYRLLTAAALRLDRLFAHSSTLTIMVKIRDEIAGHVSNR